MPKKTLSKAKQDKIMKRKENTALMQQIKSSTDTSSVVINGSLVSVPERGADSLQSAAVQAYLAVHPEIDPAKLSSSQLKELSKKIITITRAEKRSPENIIRELMGLDDEIIKTTRTLNTELSTDKIASNYKSTIKNGLRKLQSAFSKEITLKQRTEILYLEGNNVINKLKTNLRQLIALFEQRESNLKKRIDLLLTKRNILTDPFKKSVLGIDESRWIEMINDIDQRRADDAKLIVLSPIYKDKNIIQVTDFFNNISSNIIYTYNKILKLYQSKIDYVEEDVETDAIAASYSISPSLYKSAISKLSESTATEAVIVVREGASETVADYTTSIFSTQSIISSKLIELEEYSLLDKEILLKAIADNFGAEYANTIDDIDLLKLKKLLIDQASLDKSMYSYFNELLTKILQTNILKQPSLIMELIATINEWSSLQKEQLASNLVDGFSDWLVTDKFDFCLSLISNKLVSSNLTITMLTENLSNAVQLKTAALIREFLHTIKTSSAGHVTTTALDNLKRKYKDPKAFANNVYDLILDLSTLQEQYRIVQRLGTTASTDEVVVDAPVLSETEQNIVHPVIIQLFNDPARFELCINLLKKIEEGIDDIRVSEIELLFDNYLKDEFDGRQLVKRVKAFNHLIFKPTDIRGVYADKNSGQRMPTFSVSAHHVDLNGTIKTCYKQNLKKCLSTDFGITAAYLITSVQSVKSTTASKGGISAESKSKITYDGSHASILTSSVGDACISTGNFTPSADKAPGASRSDVVTDVVSCGAGNSFLSEATTASCDILAYDTRLDSCLDLTRSEDISKQSLLLEIQQFLKQANIELNEMKYKLNKINSTTNSTFAAKTTTIQSRDLPSAWTDPIPEWIVNFSLLTVTRAEATLEEILKETTAGETRSKAEEDANTATDKSTMQTMYTASLDRDIAHIPDTRQVPDTVQAIQDAVQTGMGPEQRPSLLRRIRNLFW